MSATYDPDLSTNLDWVRFLIGDTDTASARLSDAEINGAIDEVVALHGLSDGTKYCAAVIVWEGLLARISLTGESIGPVVEKAVGRLRVRRSEGGTVEDLAERFTSYLRERCAYYSSPRPRAFGSIAKIPGKFRGRRVVSG